MRNLEKMNVWEEASAKTRTQKWDKEPRPETAAMKQEGIQLDPHKDPRAGVCEASSWYV
jgi:hypothetical protein